MGYTEKFRFFENFLGYQIVELIEFDHFLGEPDGVLIDSVKHHGLIAFDDLFLRKFEFPRFHFSYL
jgi:hypothetical protein